MLNSTGKKVRVPQNSIRKIAIPLATAQVLYSPVYLFSCFPDWLHRRSVETPKVGRIIQTSLTKRGNGYKTL